MIACLVLVLGACGSGTDCRSSPSHSPNVVLIVLDTLRPDHLDLYGYPTATASFLKRLGSESVVFTRALSTSSWTAPSTASIFTGQYPTHHGVIRGFRAQRQKHRAEHKESGASTDQHSDKPDDSPQDPAQDAQNVVRLSGLPRDVATLPEAFQAAGYETFGVTANINIDDAMGFSRGFDYFKCQTQASAEEVVSYFGEMESYLRDADPYFLYLHFNDCHRPYNKREPIYRENRDHNLDNISAYDSEIHYLDSILEPLFDRFDFTRNTVVFIVSDHGEEFDEHGQRGHHFTLHHEVNRVLMMAYSPHFDFTPRTESTNVSLIDILPTLADYADLEVGVARDGVSLRPLLEQSRQGETPFAERTLFAHRLQDDPVEEHLWSAVSGPWKLIDYPARGEKLLYNHDTDSGERTDLAQVHPDIVRRLAEEIARFRADGFRQVEGEVLVPLDDELYRELDSLGYIGDGDGNDEGEEPDPARRKDGEERQP